MRKPAPELKIRGGWRGTLPSQLWRSDFTRTKQSKHGCIFCFFVAVYQLRCNVTDSKYRYFGKHHGFFHHKRKHSPGRQIFIQNPTTDHQDPNQHGKKGSATIFNQYESNPCSPCLNSENSQWLWMFSIFIPKWPIYKISHDNPNWIRKLNFHHDNRK